MNDLISLWCKDIDEWLDLRRRTIITCRDAFNERHVSVSASSKDMKVTIRLDLK